MEPQRPGAAAGQLGASYRAVISGLLFDTPAGGGGNSITNYTYDVLNHLTQVSMPRTTGTLTRMFNYALGFSVISGADIQSV